MIPAVWVLGVTRGTAVMAAIVLGEAEHRVAAEGFINDAWPRITGRRPERAQQRLDGLVDVRWRRDIALSD